MSEYGIKDGYVIRPDNQYTTEEGITDNYQNEVYQKALEVAGQYGLTSVLDLGTGRGFKLVKYFNRYRTLGLDLPPTVEVLQRLYPDRHWQVVTDDAPQGYDLVICSDVIEHVADPDAVLSFIRRADPKFLVISTPDRDLMTSGDGPPLNRCHVREWTFAEFREYIGEHFEVLDHYHSNRQQTTQCIVARNNAV